LHTTTSASLPAYFGARCQNVFHGVIYEKRKDTETPTRAVDEGSTRVQVSFRLISVQTWSQKTLATILAGMLEKRISSVQDGVFTAMSLVVFMIVAGSE